MMRRLLIIGAGGHGRSIAEAALLSGRWNEIAFVDDRYPEVTETAGWPVLAGTDDLRNLVSNFDGIVVALGDNSTRRFKVMALQDLDVPVVSIVHPKAFVSATAELGAGCTIMANATVGSNAVLGVGCIVNANACADHDTRLGDYAHLGVGVALAGGVQVGSGAFLPAGTFAGYNENIEGWNVKE